MLDNLKDKVRIGVAVLLVLLLILFVLLNFTDAEVHFLVGKVQMPIAFVVIFSFLLGAGVVYLLRLVRSKDRPHELP
jgi:uncharacterized integral membrane protein